MAHMKPVTEFGDWLVIDGNCGGETIPLDLLPSESIAKLLECDDADIRQTMDALYGLIRDYCESTKLYSADIVKAGWCARLSAAGYLDQTDWQGPYETEAEALAEVCDTFDVDEDGESVD